MPAMLERERSSRAPLSFVQRVHVPDPAGGLGDVAGALFHLVPPSAHRD
ncbi:hypothetical protein AB0M20_04955 [Actinoplanes sp. NPDC051633]